ncbi:Methionine aminopeptidase 1B [Mactra antiquata]
MDTLNSECGSDSQNSAVKGAALLLVIGEPFSEEHKKLILGEISQGFRSWDKEATGIDINDELAQIANRADLGEEGPDASAYGHPLKEGERIIRHTSENLVVEILINPQTQTVTLGVKNFLSTPTKYKHLIYSGHAFKGSGAWILQDDTFTFHNFAHAFKDQDVGNALRKQEGCSLGIFTGAEGEWTDAQIAKNDISKLLDIKLNPDEKLDNIHGVLQFTAYVSNFVRVRQLNELLQSSDVVGSIRFSRPTLYIFPGCQGDSALFGISGFNLLVNGGYSRKACFWDFTRHLDRIDAALMTHLGSDNLYGFGSVLQRKSIENVHPEIGFMYVNTSDKIKALPTNSPDEKDEDTLHVNLAKEGNKLIQYAKQIGQIPQPCSRLQSGQTIEPINLYHKVGIGSLDMYILNPITDSKELKDFYQQWNQNVSQFGLNQQMPIQNTLSVCALLVWRPSDPNDNITRIFFPGNAPQHKVLEGLEKLKSLDILKHPQCSKTSLTVKPAAKKPSGLASRPTKSRVSPATTPRSETPKKEDTPKKEITATKATASRTRATPPSSTRAKKEKEDVNKKTMKTPEKPKVEKTDKPKKTTSTPRSSAKSSTSSTPKEVPSPTKEPAKKKKDSPVQPVPSPKKEKPVEAAPVQSAPVPDVVGSAPSVDPFAEPIVNGGKESSVDPPALVPEPVQSTNEPPACQPESLIDITPSSVPEPAQIQDEPVQFQGGALDKQKMLELGIYDEDQDIEQDLNAQETAPSNDQRIPQMFGGMADSMHEDLIGDMNSQNLMQGSFHGDLMTGSIHEAMFDNKQPFDGPSYPNGGSTIEEVMTPEDDTSEEIQPQALPEPVAYAPESYGQEPDVIPIITGKEESQVVDEQQITPTAQEPDLLSYKQEDTPEYDEGSTVPVDDKLGQPSMVETPDEIENFLPEDVKEKDLSEETEKGIVDELQQQKPEQPQEEPQPVQEEQDLLKDEPQPVQEEQDFLKDEPQPVQEEQDLLKDEPQPDQEEQELLKDEPQQVLEDQDFMKDEPQPVQEEQNFMKDEPLVQEQQELLIDEPQQMQDEQESLNEEPQPAVEEPEPLKEEPHMLQDENFKDFTENQEPNISEPETTQLVDDKLDEQEVNEPLVDVTEKSPEPMEQVTNDFVSGDVVPNAAPEVTPEQMEKIPDYLDDVAPANREADIEQEQQQQLESFEQEVVPETEMVPEVPYVPRSDYRDPMDERVIMTQESINDRLSPEPQYSSPSLDEPELQLNTGLGESPEVPDVIERPISPEPNSQEQGQLLSEESEEKLVDKIENELVECQPISKEVDTPPCLAETPASDEERPDSPDSQLGASDLTRDSLERDIKEQSPIADSDDNADSIEEEQGKNLMKDEVVNKEQKNEELRDSIERSVSPDEQNAVEQPVASNKVEDNRDSVERYGSSEDGQRESVERSFEDDSDETEEEDDDEDDDESSSFEQDEATDEKCLLPDSLNEGVKPMETGLNVGQTDSVAEQPSDNLLSPESEYTDPSQGQLGYHEIDDQDGDSVEGLDEKDAFAPPPPQGFDGGFDQHADLSAYEGGPMSFAFNNNVPQNTNPFLDNYEQVPNEASNDTQTSSFNPLSEWGEPMGLPSPAPPDDKKEATAKKPAASKSKLATKTTDAKKTDVKKTETKRPSSARPSSATKQPNASNGVADKTKAKPSNTSKVSTASKAAAPKTRPSSAPVKDTTDSKSRMNGTKRPATTAGNRSSPVTSKMPPLPPFNPFYMDLTYIPNHGNPSYSDIEFFKRVRARYYVLSTLSPDTHVLDALIEGKKTWDDKSLAVTVIPTYDNETLRLWMSLHKEKLAENNIEIAPSASRCTIQLQDHETSSSAYRLEF